jgi:hypothetical protein
VSEVDFMTEQPWTIWPLVYLRVDYPKEIHEDFDLDIKLIKATQPDISENIENISSTDFAFIEEICNQTEWILAVNLEGKIDNTVSKKLAEKLRDHLENSICQSFLLCLRLIRSCPVICPVSFKTKTIEAPVNVLQLFDSDYYGMSCEIPYVHKPESLGIEDIQRLHDIWSSIVSLRRLKEWSINILDEGIFEFLKKRAKQEIERANKRFDELANQLEGVKFSEEEPDFRKYWESEGREYVYNELLEAEFLKEQEDTFASRTRIGRALTLFDEGVRLPKLHSFLSMCLVLETLFTVGEGETVHKFCIRMVKTLGSKEGLDKRKEIYKRAMDVYNQRSKIVHGEKLIETVPDAVLDDAFVLARQNLQHILRDPDLLSLYSHPGTKDKKPGKAADDALKKLRTHFLNLELGT